METATLFDDDKKQATIYSPAAAFEIRYQIDDDPGSRNFSAHAANIRRGT